MCVFFRTFAQVMNELIKYNINKRCRELNITTQHICDSIGISRSSYFGRLQGNISLASLQDIAKVLNCRVVDLLIEPCEQIVPTDCNEPVVTNLIECPNCGQKLYFHAINDIK